MATRRTPAQLQEDRLAVLTLASEWTPTSALGRYGDCAWLNKHGYLESRLVDGESGDRMLFYCPDCDEVVTTDNYEACRETMYPFHPTPRVREWRITAKGRRSLSTGNW